MRILVTGATGLVGACFLKLHADKFDKVYTLTRKPETCSKFDNITFELGSGAPLKLPFVDAVIHFAAQTSAIVNEQTFVTNFKVNSIGTGELLNACLELKVRPFFIYIGTATQLGYTNKLYQMDDLPTDSPTTLYDLGKLAGEQLLFNLIQTGSIRGCSLRLCNVFGHLGPRLKSDRGLLDKIYEKCLNGEKIEILGNGKFYRDYIHVEDVADAINCTIETRNQMNDKKYYLGSGQAVYLKKAFTIIREVAFRKTGKFSEIKETNIPGNINKIHLRHFQADITEFSQVSGWCLQKNCTTYECNKS